jgi:hypothetical protein
VTNDVNGDITPHLTEDLLRKSPHSPGRVPPSGLGERGQDEHLPDPDVSLSNHAGRRLQLIT